MKDGHDNLAARGTATGDMPLEQLDILDNNASTLTPGGATDTTTIGDTATRHRTLEGAKDEFPFYNAVEACPPEVKRGIYHGGNICHIGDGVALALNKGLDLPIEQFIFCSFIARGDNKILSHSVSKKEGRSTDMSPTPN